MQIVQRSQGFALRTRLLLGAALAPLFLVSGCATNAQTGALAGAAGGGAAGALIGSAAHVPVLGAVVGATAGTLIGSSVGAAADDADRRKAIQADVAARGGPLSLEQIRDMAQHNVSDTLIIDQIRTTRTVFQLTTEQVTWLHEQGVSDTVIHYMQNTIYGPRRVVYVDPGPPPPVVGVGVVYGRRW
jgi:hypothetical protein